MGIMRQEEGRRTRRSPGPSSSRWFVVFLLLFLFMIDVTETADTNDLNNLRNSQFTDGLGNLKTSRRQNTEVSAADTRTGDKLSSSELFQRPKTASRVHIPSTTSTALLRTSSSNHRAASSVQIGSATVTNRVHHGNHTGGRRARVFHLYFPTSIDTFEVRKDRHTQQPVTRGNIPQDLYLNDADYVNPTIKKMSLHELKRTLQCAPDEPALNGISGALAMLEYMPPTRETLDVMCAWAETHCTPWSECQRLASEFKQGKYPTPFGMDKYDGFAAFYLVKIHNSTLYQGWPWGAERMKVNYSTEPHQLIADVVTLVKDLPDSVFFYGGERPYLPMDFPFPALSFAPRIGFNNIAWPFQEGYLEEFKLVSDMYNKEWDIKNETILDGYYDRKPWNQRIPKAAFFANLDVYRRMIFEVARANPDLFDVSLNRKPKLLPINPTSKEGVVEFEKIKDNITNDGPFGYAASIYSLPHDRIYNPAHYKYVIVPLGQQGLSTSGRIFSLLANSKSVVLLQKGPFSYHIGERLQPWVHYVPFSESGAELADIIGWLREHDDLAQRIAENGYNFGRSYLRMEDYLCYGVTVLNAIGEVMKGSSILTEPLDMSKAEAMKRFRL